MNDEHPVLEFFHKSNNKDYKLQVFGIMRKHQLNLYLAIGTYYSFIFKA